MIFFQTYFILVPFLAGLFAEILKMLIDLIRGRKKIRFLNSGGMPSGHSAFVGSLLMTVAYREGWGSTLFLVTLVFSFLVMYDATHIRYEAGKHAQAINKMDPSLKFQESLGHTVFQALVGAGIGAGVAGLLLFV